jgi:CRISPR/Cas system endoribonuclease Cas6 (RAMP superfamily)
MLRKISLILLVALPLLFPLSTLAAGPLASSLKGRILLQVESKGEAWYVDPVTEKRVFLGRPADAFAVMRSYGLGISNADLAKIAAPGEKSSISSLAKTLAGRILLQVQSKGEAWYVSPVDFKKYYLGRPADAFALMRAKGLGISNANLEKIISKAPAIAPTETLPNVVSAPVTPTAPQTNPASTTPNAEVKATSTTQVPAAT